MQIQVKMTPINRNNGIAAVGTIKFGEISIRNFTLMRNSKDELFIVMPCRDTGKKDKDGKRIYEDIAYPLKKELREELKNAAIESYKGNRAVNIQDEEDGKILISAEVFDKPYFSRVGKCKLIINDMFLISDVYINENKKGDLYVTMPNYKTNQVNKDGKALFSEIVIMSKEFKSKLSDAIINEFNLEKKHIEQNRFTLKSRLEQAKIRAMSQPVKETKHIEISR